MFCTAIKNLTKTKILNSALVVLSFGDLNSLDILTSLSCKLSKLSQPFDQMKKPIFQTSSVDLFTATRNKSKWLVGLGIHRLGSGSIWYTQSAVK